MELENKYTSKRLKNKQKPRFKKMLKKCGKIGTDVENSKNYDCYKYLMRIMDSIDNIRNDSYEMGVLAENVLNEIKGNELFFIKMGPTSKLLEDLLPHSSDETFSEFIKPIIDNLRPVFSDRIASHILQNIVLELFRRYLKIISKSEEKTSIIYYDILLKIAGFSLNNFTTFIHDPICNHTIRTILNVLSGQAVQGDKYDSSISIPPEFHSYLMKFVQVILQNSNFKALCCTTSTSAFLQSLLFATRYFEDACNSIIKKLIKELKNEELDLKDKENEPILRLLEVALEVASEKYFKKIYKKFVKNDIRGLSTSRTGNFIVQKLIKYCKTKELFEIIFDELNEAGRDIFQKKNKGIFVELSQGCVKHKTRQGDFVKIMLNVLQCRKTLNDDSDITPLLCCMITSDEYDPEKLNIDLHGALIVQAMLRFGKPIKIINSLLNMETKYLVEVVCDPRGCHIIDSFMESSTVGEKSRDRLFKRLTGYYTKLATSKHGSRALDAIWNAITYKNRVLLMEELKENEAELTSSPFGKIFAIKHYLSVFRRDRADWINKVKALESTKRHFSHIIPCKKQKVQD